MWRGTRILGNSTRLGRGKSGISINSYEEFFVLARLIDRASGPSEQERAQTMTEPLRDRSNFARRPDNRVLHNFRCLIHPLDNVLADTVESRELDMERFAGIRDHGLDTPELIAR